MTGVWPVPAEVAPPSGDGPIRTKPQASANGFKRVDLMGLALTAVSEKDTIEHVMSELAGGRGGWICTVNLDMLRQCRRSAELLELVSNIDLIVADGMPLVWACGLRGTPLPERVAGSSLTVSLTAAAADAGSSVFLLGGKPGTADQAARNLEARHPGLRVVGTLCPPIGFEGQPGYLELIDSTLRAADPDIVFVALGFPKQDRLIQRLRLIVPNAWHVGCGISLSFVAGELRRAPPMFQRLGLEWLWRLAQEPRRLFRRYLFDGPPFLVVLLWQSLLVRVGVSPVAPAHHDA